MFEQKSCEKCEGTQYRVLVGATVQGGGYLIGAAANDDHWFCPDCSWGSEPDDAA